LSISRNSRDELPNTYVVEDRTNEEEMTRLQMQDKMITANMGGTLPEQADLTSVCSMLDVGCGTGGWLIQVARTHPDISRLVGIDVNEKMLEIARTEAASQQESSRVDFRPMDVLRKLDFPDASFDLVNQRFALSYLRTWDWAHVLGEYQRVVQPGGVIRITECNIPESSSPALNRLNDLLIEAFTNAGHFSAPERDDVINGLASRLHQAGIRNIQTRPYTIEYLPGTPEREIFIEDTKHVFRTFLPFFRKWSHVPDDYEAIRQQAYQDMQQPDFKGTWKLLTVWGNTMTT